MITQLLSRITNADSQQPHASSPMSDATITLLGDDAAKPQTSIEVLAPKASGDVLAPKASSEVLAPKADAADHHDYSTVPSPKDDAAEHQASCEVLPLKDRDDMIEVADALTAKLVTNKSLTRRQVPATCKKNSFILFELEATDCNTRW